MTLNAPEPVDPYPPHAIPELLEGLDGVAHDLSELRTSLVEHAQILTSARAEEFLIQGAARRLGILRRCLLNVFRVFPPTARRPVPPDDLDDAQINLHAFVINVYGLFDNLAWAFLCRHGLENRVDRNKIGMFLEATKGYLPAALRSYFDSPKMMNWFTQYLKNYRDALAHRIPLYIPPASYSDADAARSAAIDREELDHIRTRDWEQLRALRAEQRELGVACPLFVHSFRDPERSAPLVLHPQMLSDAKTVIEACTVYLAHWHERDGTGSE